jgi:hypothetical protein
LKKTIYTLDVDNYAPEITALTRPLLRAYADKIGAFFHIIDQRLTPQMPPVYEKLQIRDLMIERGDEWAIYVDADALVHPDFFDPTNHLEKSVVLHNGVDMAGNRWRYDEYFRRDGRHVGSCNWFTIASDWCVDLWAPLHDMTFKQALANIFPTQNELNTIITREHLIDDYILSRNIARFGLHVTTMSEVLARLGRPNEQYLFHEYTLPIQEKVVKIKEMLSKWGCNV